MKAVVYTRYGSPDVLRLGEVDTPAPADDEVLVKIRAASVNAADWHRLRGKPLVARFRIGGFRKPKYPVLGSDIAGRVEAVGKDVTQLQPGDEVFGGIGQGGFAEYASVHASRLLVKPAHISFASAAALPIAAVTALQALHDKGQIQAGQTVVINGACGGVGTFAVQIAKAFGAEVTGVCSTRNLATARRIGADHVIDYTREDFTRNGRRYDLIIDIAANHTVSDYKRVLSSEGICVRTGFSTVSHLLRSSLRGAWAARTGTRKFVAFTAQLKRDDLLLLTDWLAAGKLIPVIDRCYPVSQVADAMRYFGVEHARGKVIIAVEPGSCPS